MSFVSTASRLEVSGTDDFLELEAGVLYAFTVEARDLQDAAIEILIQGETLPKDDLGQLGLYPMRSSSACAPPSRCSTRRCGWLAASSSASASCATS